MTSTGYGAPQGFAGTTEARKHPHTPVRDNKSTGNILYIYTRARENPLEDPRGEGREDLRTDPCGIAESIKSAYYMALGYYPSPRNQQQVLALMESGASACLIEAVLAYTAEHAPRPSWAYAQAVLRRKLAEGITTGEAFECSVAAWYGQQAAQPAAIQPRQRSAKQVIEQQYSQREYIGPKYSGELTPEEIAEVLRYASPVEEVRA